MALQRQLGTTLFGRHCGSRAKDDFLLVREFIGREEQAALLGEVERVLQKAPWSPKHFDSVIANYREHSVGPSARAELYPALCKLHERVRCEFFLGSRELLDPHVLQLAPDGYILPHLDNARHYGGP